MLSGLRIGTPLYVLYRNEPRIAIGEVLSVSNPVPVFGTTYQNGMMMPPKSTVDVKVKINGEEVTFQKLPADQSVADFGTSGIVLSESREAILTEIEGLRKLSEKTLQERPRHEHIITECDKMLGELNPQAKREAAQAQEIASLKSDMGTIKGMLAQLLGQKEKQL